MWTNDLYAIPKPMKFESKILFISDNIIIPVNTFYPD